ncbi:MAG TPA: aquaporin Z [Acidimicrobiales bacterium]|nr:aquaporin Z [Acidimicrobiales bacterium]
MELQRKLIAELLGTLWLVLGGCGSAVLAANFMPDTNLGIGLAGVSLAFGLTVLTAAYALGHISGGHFNPAVTLGVFVARRIEARDAIAYVVAQLVGAILGTAIIVAIASGVDGFSIGTGPGDSNLAVNGWANLSPGGYDWVAAAVVEVVLTFFFLLLILGVTGRDAPIGFAGLTIGLALTLIHLISIPVTNTSVNPARSTGPAIFVGGDALEQLWLFWVAPLLGAALAGFVHSRVIEEQAVTVEGYGETLVDPDLVDPDAP